MDPVAAAKSALQGTTASQAGPSQFAGFNPGISGFTPGQGFAPVGSGAPSVGATAAPEIQAMYAPQFQAGPLAAQAGSVIGKASTDFSNLQQQQQADRMKAIQDSTQHVQDIQNAMNPKLYKKELAPDGGYRYQDGAGNPINFFQYWQATGQSPDKILAGSQNSLDQQAVLDYKNMDTLHTALLNNDQQTIGNTAQKLGFKDSQDLMNQMKQAGIHTPDDLQQRFMNTYPNLFDPGAGQVGQVRNFGFGHGGANTFF